MDKPLNILYLEDNPQDVELVKALLLADDLSCTVISVESSATFVAALKRNDIDLIISDYSLPGFNGLAALKIASETMPETPFILFSGTLGEDAAIESLRNGATDYVLKHRFKRLVPAVRRALIQAQERRERRRAEETLRLRNSAIEASINPIIITNSLQPDDPIEYVNPAFERMTGYTAAEVMGRNCRFLQGRHPDLSGIASIRALLREQRAGQVVIKNYRKDGCLFWNELHLAPVQDVDGHTTHFIGVLNDITETKRYQEQLEHQAKYDFLTHLPNRSLLYDRLEQAITYAQSYQRGVGVAFIDLDHFKLINDGIGHDVGDQILTIVAQRLKKTVRAVDTVARWGGDEFVVILYNLAQDDILAHFLQNLLATVRQTVTVEDREFNLTCSIGLSLYPQDGRDMAILLRSADAAMYRAKEQGRDNFQSYTPEMHERINERLTLENSLRQALARQEFVLYYQPQIDLRSGRMVGVEALIRWQHPEMGLISPARFIPVAEDSGLILPIGEWVIRTACAQNKAWQTAGLPPITVAVNVSARQFSDKKLAMLVAQVLRETSLEACYLELELTESLVMHNAEDTIVTLRALKALGVRLAIDDFGTGYSSLAYLRQFPVDRLKIDQSFVQEISTNSNNTVIVKAVISLGHSLNIDVIAEGVESQAQLEFLHTHDCDEVQGYYFSKPVPPEQFIEVLTGSRYNGVA
ncbi:MAG: hypothetical protein QG599_2560 [Pseudomonadota bacterium]|nr:hypothetical protein [Pseudomonadota bacterium]